MSRLVTGGKGFKYNKTWKRNMLAQNDFQSAGSMKEVRIEQLPSFSAVVEWESEFATFTGDCAYYHHAHGMVQQDAISPRSIDAQTTLATAMAESDRLIDDAILRDHRLAKRAQWVRSDDGLFADAGLCAMGDDSPCFAQSRNALRDQAAAAEPVHVVISTDSSTSASLAAIIATIRLVQQFRPVRVTWQGAWLHETEDYGYVLLAPLIDNDMDFSRLSFVVSSLARDYASFAALTHCTRRDKLRIDAIGRHANRSFVDDTLFVGKEGIEPTAEEVGNTACSWLGWDSPYYEAYDRKQAAEGALQHAPEPSKPYEPEPDTRSDAEKARAAKKERAQWDKWSSEAARKARREARERLGNIR
jgi:hypothetical protein